jgi:hypothetical protein
MQIDKTVYPELHRITSDLTHPNLTLKQAWNYYETRWSSIREYDLIDEEMLFIDTLVSMFDTGF